MNDQANFPINIETGWISLMTLGKKVTFFATDIRKKDSPVSGPNDHRGYIADAQGTVHVRSKHYDVTSWKK